MKKKLFKELLVSIKEAKELGLCFDDTCHICGRVLPNEDCHTKNGCIWCTIPKEKK